LRKIGENFRNIGEIVSSGNEIFKSDIVNPERNSKKAFQYGGFSSLSLKNILQIPLDTSIALPDYNFDPHPDPPEVFSGQPLPPWGETGKGVKDVVIKSGFHKLQTPNISKIAYLLMIPDTH
jgi:hypothetical protein